MSPLNEYRRKRDFQKTAEPRGQTQRETKSEFVVQKHAATRLHYDFRLAIDGVLKSWAVPKGPSLNPGDKRLAIQVEDHPIEYGGFEGIIPKGQYGGGEVIVWDRGTFEPEGNRSASEQVAGGELKFRLFGEKLRGSFVLVRLKRDPQKNEWLLIKHRDEYADSNWNADEHPESVLSGKTLQDMAEASPDKVRQWQSRVKDRPVARKALTPGIKAQGTAAPMPENVDVMLAQLADEPFSDPNWLFEIKWDGIRAVAYVRADAVQLFSRSKRDITHEYPEFHDLDRALKASTAILDGELVVLDQDGRSVFQRIQNRVGIQKPSEKLRKDHPVTFYVFDLLYLDGIDIRRNALVERKRLLADILKSNDQVRFSQHQLQNGKELFAAAEEQSLEGIIAKKLDSSYIGGRTSAWLKLKIQKELDAVVVGWTEPRGSRKYFGALVLGLYSGKQLEFIGSVGTGFDTKLQNQLFERLQKLEESRSSFRNPPRLREEITWVRPEMVARVKYANWTDDKHLRAPVFLGLRNDRDPESCTFLAENPKPSTPNGETREEAEPETPRADEPQSTHQAHPATKAATHKVAAKQKTTRKKTSSKRQDKDSANSYDYDELKNGTTDGLTLELDSHQLKLTHLNKIYFPRGKFKKRDLLAYYLRMAPRILPFIEGRPMVLRRYPDGVDGKSFFQKEAPSFAPEWMKRATIFSDERGGDMDYIMADSAAALLYLTNLGCIDHNPWSSRADSQDCPDYVFFDLDPTPGTPFKDVLKLARCINSVLGRLKLARFLKTSGASGFHIFVPLERKYTYEQTRNFAAIVGRVVADEVPELVTFERSVRKRPKGRILFDSLQNAKGKPLACAYSVRAEAEASISTPITERELQHDFDLAQWNLATIDARLDGVGDLWKDFWDKRQGLDRAISLLEPMVRGAGSASKSPHKKASKA